MTTWCKLKPSSNPVCSRLDAQHATIGVGCWYVSTITSGINQGLAEPCSLWEAAETYPNTVPNASSRIVEDPVMAPLASSIAHRFVVAHPVPGQEKKNIWAPGGQYSIPAYCLKLEKNHSLCLPIMGKTHYVLGEMLFLIRNFVC